MDRKKLPLIVILPTYFGINDLLKPITNVKRLRYPTTYFIHCDLIDKNYNFFNNKRSDLLAKIDVKGKPYEKVRYDASPQQPIRDCSTSFSCEQHNYKCQRSKWRAF